MTDITFFTKGYRAEQLNRDVVYFDGDGTHTIFRCQSEEQAFYLTKALNNDYRNSSLNISLIDTMFLIWSLRLMTNLYWGDIYDFIEQAIGIRAATTLALFREADRRVEPDGGAGRIEKGHSLKHGEN